MEAAAEAVAEALSVADCSLLQEPLLFRTLHSWQTERPEVTVAVVVEAIKAEQTEVGLMEAPVERRTATEVKVALAVAVAVAEAQPRSMAVVEMGVAEGLAVEGAAEELEEYFHLEQVALGALEAETAPVEAAYLDFP